MRKPLASYSSKFHLSAIEKAVGSLQLRQNDISISGDLNGKDQISFNPKPYCIASKAVLHHSTTQRELDSPMILSRLLGKNPINPIPALLANL